jgi:hypothetical protein
MMAGDGSTEHTDREWLIPMAAVAALQFSAWYVMWRLGFARAPLVGLYNLVALAGLAMGLAPFTIRYVLKIWKEGEENPIRRIGRDLDRSRVAAVAGALALGAITAGAFSAMKGAVPVAVPFYLDPALARLDRAVFGTDPWHLTHALFGWATPAIDEFYLTWLLVMLVAFNLVLLTKPSAFKTQSLVAYVLMWPLVGTLGSFAFSSAGPIFHDALFGGNSGLIATLQQEGATRALGLAQRLWAAYVHRYDTLGSGISAMPSMHIAMACWAALTFRAAFPRFGWIGWTYVGLIWFSSVHLGWHYVSDGVAGIAGALLVWRIAGAISSSRVWSRLERKQLAFGSS